MRKRILSLLLAVTVSVVGNISCVAAKEGVNLTLEGSELTSSFDNYTGRYIVKYKTADTSCLSKNTINRAFDKAMNKKEAMLDSLSADNTVASEEKDKIENKLKKQGNRKNTEASEIELENADIIEINKSKYEIIQLAEDVSPDVFQSEIESFVGDKIDYIQPDYTVTLSADDVQDKSFEMEIQAADINFDEAADDVIVAVLDTGIDVLHEALQNAVVQGYDFCNNSTDIKINPKSTEDIHGTHIASVIASNAGNVKIMPLKVFEDGKAYTSDIIEAISFAKENGAEIINCSWGGNEYNKVLEEAIDESGLLFVCSAGNSGRNLDNNPIYPACFGLNNIISVASVNDDLGISGFSNFGINSVDIAARGRDIYGAYINNEYGTMSA